MRKLTVVFTVLLLLFFALSVYGATPMKSIEGTVNKVLEVLRDPALQGDANKDAKAKKIEIVADEMFDWKALSMRTLGKGWKKFSTDQQKEFMQLFRDILKNAWIDRILAYKDEKVVFDKEVMLSEKKAEVQSKVITASAEIPINYRMFKRGDEWKVYDMVIEGISLIQNYRTQFRSILAKGSPEDLLKKLREKEAK
jgi:phospholipid transport system substrate-binding protein